MFDNFINIKDFKKLYRQICSYKKRLAFRLNDYYTHNPTAIIIELSNRCNLACKMCWFHGENGIGDRYKGLELETEEILKFLKQLVPFKPKIYFGGSEPFIRDDFLLILEYLKSQDFKVSFATNGSLLNMGMIERLVEIGVDDIKFSIDGNEEVHDHIRGKGVFKKVTQAVKDITSYKKRIVRNKPYITINITITQKIIKKLSETIAAIRKAVNDSADFYRLHHLWYVSENELSTHRFVIKKTLGCEATEAKAHLVTPLGIWCPVELADEIDHIRRIKRISFFPNLQHDEIIKYYSEGVIVKERCSAPFLGAVIKPNGEVKLCPDAWIDDYIIGNIRHEKFLDIWNNRLARNFRRIIIKQKHFAGCKRCSAMYSFNLL